MVINKDEAFLTDAIDKATTFFKYGILPELIAKWYTRPSSFSTDTETSSQTLSTSSKKKSQQVLNYGVTVALENREHLGHIDLNKAL